MRLEGAGVRLVSAYESINHKVRAAELRANAIELERRGYPMFAEVDRELAEWLDPTPRERDREPRRTRPVQGEVVALPVNHRGPYRRETRQRVPSGTTVVASDQTGRVLRRRAA